MSARGGGGGPNNWADFAESRRHLRRRGVYEALRDEAFTPEETQTSSFFLLLLLLLSLSLSLSLMQTGCAPGVANRLN